MTEYRDDAVFIPGRGAVLIGDDAAEAPALTEVRAWIDAGAAGPMGNYHPLGYTSVDELPGIETEIEGGEQKGSWENPSLRLTAIKATDTITVTPIQWSPEPLQHRFGPGPVDAGGYFQAPAVYRSTRVSMLVIVIDGGEFLVIQMPRVESKPEGSIEMDPESFLGLPITYTVLAASGNPKFNIGLEALLAGTDGDAPAEESGDGAANPQ